MAQHADDTVAINLEFKKMKINKHIEIVRTDIRRLSSMSHASAIKIHNTLSKYYQEVNISVVNNVIDLELLVRKRPDLVFLGLKHLETEDTGGNPVSNIWVSDYLDQNNISYTGSQSVAIKLDYDKSRSKNVVHEAGLQTAQYFIANPGLYDSAQSLPLGFPLFVKPLSTGGGTGIGDDSVVRNFRQYQRKVKAIFESYGSNSLVEQYLTGHEFSVAILQDSANELLVMPIQIITKKNSRGDRVLGSRVKTEDAELVIGVPGKVLKARICQFAADVYKLLGGRDLGRIDIRMDSEGRLHFIEANFVPAPGTRYFAGACLINEHMDYKTMILRIVELGMARSSTARTKHTVPLNSTEVLI